MLLVRNGYLECMKRVLVVEGDSPLHTDARQYALLAWRNCIAYGIDVGSLAVYFAALQEITCSPKDGNTKLAQLVFSIYGKPACAIGCSHVDSMKGLQVHAVSTKRDELQPTKAWSQVAPILDPALKLLAASNAGWSRAGKWRQRSNKGSGPPSDGQIGLTAQILTFIADYYSRYCAVLCAVCASELLPRRRLPAQDSYDALETTSSIEHMMIAHVIPLATSAVADLALENLTSKFSEAAAAALHARVLPK